MGWWFFAIPIALILYIVIQVEIENISDVKLSDEHEEYKWCSYTEAKEYLKWEHNLIALDKLMRRI